MPFIGLVDDVLDIRLLCSSGVRRSLRDDGTKSSMSSSSSASAKELNECVSVDIRESTGKEPTEKGTWLTPDCEETPLLPRSASEVW